MAEVKPGYKTTEFWLVVAAVVVGLIIESGVVIEGSTVSNAIVFISQVLAVLGYSYSRGIVKS